MPGDEKWERKTISLSAEVYAKALENARRRGFARSFSAYIAWLIERDAAGDVTRETLMAPRRYTETHLRVAEPEQDGGSDTEPAG